MSTVRGPTVTLSNGVVMPLAGLGTYTLTPDKAEASVVCVLKCGCRLIDTANAYVNEKAVGRGMKQSGLKRKEIFLETKLWPTFFEQPDAVDKMLEWLGTDYIDLLLIHQPVGNYVAGYRQMEKAYHEGKVWAISLSNFSEERVKEILVLCEVRPVVLQTELHPYLQEKELRAFCACEGITLQSWFSLGHGDKVLLVEPLFVWLGEKYGKTPAQIILRWVVQSGIVAILGSKTPAHIHNNFSLFDFELTPAKMDEIAAFDKKRHYYTFTEENLKAFATMKFDVEGQK